MKGIFRGERGAIRAKLGDRFMARGNFVIIGRSTDAPVCLHEPSISARHARLEWRRGELRIVDLGSANGTFVDGNQVREQTIRIGDDVMLGGVPFPWSHPVVQDFIHRGARRDTLVSRSKPGEFACGRCGARMQLPPGLTKGEITCPQCSAKLDLEPAIRPPRRRARRRSSLSWLLAGITALWVGVAVWWVGWDSIANALRRVGKETGVVQVPQPDWALTVGSPEELSIRIHRAPAITAAIDPSDSKVRNLAARTAASDQGPFHVGQVAAIWGLVRGQWRYVNDPHGDEYFAKASETIDNEMIGDCDDFAIVLAAMIESVGGDARIVISDGERGGHAYAEACIPDTAENVVSTLQKHYRTRTDRASRQIRVRELNHRTDANCGVWLNLDWSAEIPGGPYGQETWAVAVYPSGKTETLAVLPAAPPTGE